MTETITITRRSKVGFGYNAGASQVWNESQTQSFLQVDKATRPDHTGTILQVNKAISEDRTLASYRGGTYYTTAWFVKVRLRWRRIVNDDHNMYELGKLTEEQKWYNGQPGYTVDAVTVEIE